MSEYERVLSNARNQLSYASFAMSHYVHGYLLGITHRDQGVDSSAKFANEFQAGYCDGWLYLDAIASDIKKAG